MKTKHLLLLLLVVIAPWTAMAQRQIIIGSGDGTNVQIPSNNNRNFGISQQIYTAEEINASGNITSISFYNANTNTQANRRLFNIYLAHTTKTSFESSSDWINVTGANMVYYGTSIVELLPNQWTTFNFSTPFAYNGVDNLVLVVIDRSNSYCGTGDRFIKYRVFSTGDNNQAIYQTFWDISGELHPDGTQGTEPIEGVLLAQKNQIILGGIGPLPAPTNLHCNGVTGTSAILEWTQNLSANAWQICLNNDETHLIEANSNPFTLTGLTLETSYTAKVRTNFGNGEYSHWSDEITFFATNARLIEDFEGISAAPSGWTTDGGGSWTFDNRYHAHGEQCAYFRAYGNGNTNKLITPPMNLSQEGLVELSFLRHMDHMTLSMNNELNVYYRNL